MVKLSTVATVGPKLPVTINDEKLEVTFLPMKLVEEEINKIHLTESKTYAAVKKGYTPMADGDVIFAKITPCMENGKIAIADKLRNGIAFGSTEFHVIRCGNKLYNKYLFYFLVQKKYRHLAESNMRGAVGQRRVPKKFIEDTFLPLSSFTTQRMIADKIEELFGELDKGVENLRLAQQQLKTYRLAVLKWAFEGRLTSKSVSKGDLPEGWSKFRLKDVCTKIQDGSHFSPQEQFDEPDAGRYKYITAKNIRNDYMDFRKLTYVGQSFHDSIYGRCNPEHGDVLLTKDGVNTGEVTLNTLSEPISLLSSVCLFKTNVKLLIPSFLKFFIQSPGGNKSIIGDMTGTAIKRIVLKKIKEAQIILPDVHEQKIIIDQIESRLSLSDKLKDIVEQNLQQVEVLRQSILKKAFEGKLFSEDSAVKSEIKKIKSTAFTHVA